MSWMVQQANFFGASPPGTFFREGDAVRQAKMILEGLLFLVETQVERRKEAQEWFKKHRLPAMPPQVPAEEYGGGAEGDYWTKLETVAKEIRAHLDADEFWHAYHRWRAWLDDDVVLHFLNVGDFHIWKTK